MKPQAFTLSNGLQVVFVDTQAFPTLTTLLLVGAGSRYENARNNGIAHFFEHMAFKGSKKYPNAFLISSIIDRMGGSFNAFTSKDHTGYYIKTTRDQFGKVVDVLSDMVLNSLLLAGEIEKEKGVIVEEINMYEDMPQRKVGELFEGLMYGGSSLGYDIAGTRNTVTAFNRQTFTDYMAQLYHPDNAVLAVAGGLGDQARVKEYLKIIEEKFGPWGRGNRSDFVKIKVDQAKPKILIKKKDTEQAHFCLGFPTFSFFDKRKYPLALLAAILGGGMSSRLFMEVREKRGLCYYISTGREMYHDTGNIVTQAGVTRDLSKVKEAVGVVLNEHKKVARGEVTSDELGKAKDMVKGRLLLSLEDSFNVGHFFGMRKLLENNTETPDEVLKKLEKVTLDNIVELADELFKHGRINFTIIGPFDRDAIGEKDLDV